MRTNNVVVLVLALVMGGIAAFMARQWLQTHAVVSAAAALRLEAGVIGDARLALGGVALKPWRARNAEKTLIGARADAPLFHRAAEVALAEAKPSGDNAFKIDLASRVVACALALAAAGTPERMPALPASPFAAVSGVLAHA